MRKYIIFLILLSIVKNRAVVPCVGMKDWYTSGDCKGPDGEYRKFFQYICWTCIQAPKPRTAGALEWKYTKGYLPGKECPSLHTRSSRFYKWDLRHDTYPPKPVYAKRTYDSDAGYGEMRTTYDQYKSHWVKGNPCSSITSASAPTLPTRQFAVCIYSLMCEETHQAEIRWRALHPPPARARALHPPPPPPAREIAHVPRGIAAPPRRRVAPHTRVRAVRGIPPARRIPAPRASSARDFDDMLDYYIGDISDYLNNEYTDYDGYDLDDQFGEMLMDMYMEGYKAGLNVRKWS